jgi:GNAT superfamily N-acetyltransferase
MTAVRIREEPADGAAARRLYAEYMQLLRDRLGAEFAPSERIFATEDAFSGDGGAWLVAYGDDGRPVACGGLRTLDPGVGEIKRMFVIASERGSGLGRRLLRELERRAAAYGHRCVRLLTTEALHEAAALYAAEGYRVVERIERPGEPVEIWLEKQLPGRRGARYS